MGTTRLGVVGRLIRIARLVGFGRNPLRRPSDRVEGLVLVVAALIVVTAVPAGVVAGRAVAADRSREAARLAAEGRPATAVLLADAPAPAGDGIPTARPVPARWRVDGHTRTGTVTVRPGLHRGDTVPVRVDAAGAPLAPPEPRERIALDGVGTGLAVLFGAGAAALLLGVATRWLLDRRRLAAWTAAWSAGRRRDEHRR